MVNKIMRNNVGWICDVRVTRQYQNLQLILYEILFKLRNIYKKNHAGLEVRMFYAQHMKKHHA